MRGRTAGPVDVSLALAISGTETCHAVGDAAVMKSRHLRSLGTKWREDVCRLRYFVRTNRVRIPGYRFSVIFPPSADKMDADSLTLSQGTCGAGSPEPRKQGVPPRSPEYRKTVPGGPDEAAGEGNQPSVSDWVSRDEFGRQTCPLRESQDRNLRMRHALIRQLLYNRSHQFQSRAQPRFFAFDRRQKRIRIPRMTSGKSLQTHSPPPEEHAAKCLAFERTPAATPAVPLPASAGTSRAMSAQFRSDCPQGVLGRRALTRKTVSSKLAASASGRHT